MNTASWLHWMSCNAMTFRLAGQVCKSGTVVYEGVTNASSRVTSFLIMVLTLNPKPWFYAGVYERKPNRPELPKSAGTEEVAVRPNHHSSPNPTRLSVSCRLVEMNRKVLPNLEDPPLAVSWPRFVSKSVYWVAERPRSPEKPNAPLRSSSKRPANIGPK